MGTGHSNAGNCQVPGCVCTGYVSGYVESRRDENKPDIDPYAGQSAQHSSCIVLNWIPKNEFEAAVALSIQNKDPGGALAPTPAQIPGQPLPPLYKLKWTFVGRAGAVRHATAGAVDLDNGTWCEVGARKIAGGPLGITSTWVIQHWQGQG